MARSTMHIVALGVILSTTGGLVARTLRGQDSGGVEAASHEAPPATANLAGGGFSRGAMVRELMKRRGGEPSAAAQLVQLVATFDAAEAFAAFEELALAHERAGQLNLAAEARLMAMQTYPQEPGARRALLWLTRLYASSEVAHRYRPAGQAADAKFDRGTALYAYQLAESTASAGAVGGRRRDEPALAFARAAAARRAGLTKAGATLLATLKHAKAGNPWGDCARLEAWLEAGQLGDAPKQAVRCERTKESLRLDGVLDEACWAASAADREEGEKRGDRATEPHVRWTWDGEYLYVAVRCAKAANVAYPQDERARIRDADLAAFDRVRLLIDVDRDYATCFELTIDSRGWTHDACWGDVAWNPEWFVASGGTETEWTAEAAIALEQLGVQGTASGAACAIAVERALPPVVAKARAEPSARGDSQPTSTPMTTPGPEAFDVLVFE